MSRARRDFLSGGYYKNLADALSDEIRSFEIKNGSLLDACCGDGYYTSILHENTGLDVYAFDISKDMVKFAAKKNKALNCFVAGIHSIPLFDGSMDVITRIFAPSNDAEFIRVLKRGGRLITVTPGREHLMELKEILYETPYYNDEEIKTFDGAAPEKRMRVRNEFRVDGEKALNDLFKMTPYYYKTSPKDAEKLKGINSLSLTSDFIISEYRIKK